MNTYRVQVWIVVEEESEVDAAASVEYLLQDFPAIEVEVDWDSAEEVEDEDD